MTAIEDFRDETRAWLAENCPPGARRRGPSFDGIRAGDHEPDTTRWLERMVEKGWTAPMWPLEYGGGGLSFAENSVLTRELRRIDARFPLIGIAASVIGSTLLEFGTEDQKRRHLPPIVRTQRAWCQGYSEPGAGSDLASLQTRAEDRGDHFVINGRKIWTSGAQSAEYAGGVNGRIADSALRRDILAYSMNDLAFRLTRRRAMEEARGGTPGSATSIFKMYATELEQAKASLLTSMRGTQGLGWSGAEFDQACLEGTRNWLWSRAASIYSGSNEIQRNIIAKRVLGLPD